ncbi:MAG: Coenzyme F420 hydrogenase/dehydrogenase, beta subunit C-terminal domain, partial [Oscillospiraceae bacterium]|nr:Coenzyme F420 hydrogenase/dehydrogenase, beta subunit C-terminal domain [Oscillospiraceae bacterium]
IERKAESVVRRVHFRHKRYGWKTYSVLFEFLNGTEYIKRLTEDLYMKGFLSNLYLRPSCYRCSFKGNNYSDITLADFWGIENVVAEMNDDKGVSLVIVNTLLGESVINSLTNRMKVKAVDFNKALQNNPSYFKSVPRNALRKHALKDFTNMPFDKVIDKYCGRSFVSKCRRKLFKIIGG